VNLLRTRMKRVAGEGRGSKEQEQIDEHFAFCCRWFSTFNSAFFPSRLAFRFSSCRQFLLNNQFNVFLCLSHSKLLPSSWLGKITILSFQFNRCTSYFWSFSAAAAAFQAPQVIVDSGTLRSNETSAKLEKLSHSKLFHQRNHPAATCWESRCAHR